MNKHLLTFLLNHYSTSGLQNFVTKTLIAKSSIQHVCVRSSRNIYCRRHRHFGELGGGESAEICQF